MIFLDNDKHHKLYAHVYYGKYKASVGLDGKLLRGSIPLKKLKLLQTRMILHEEELHKDRNNSVQGLHSENIKPLD